MYNDHNARIYFLAAAKLRLVNILPHLIKMVRIFLQHFAGSKEA